MFDWIFGEFLSLEIKYQVLAVLILLLNTLFFLVYIISLAWFSFARNIRLKNISKRKALLALNNPQEEVKRVIIGFFHPYWSASLSISCRSSCTQKKPLFSNAGGGGERVLWAAISWHLVTNPHSICVIYSGDVDSSKEEIISKVQVSNL
jgi:alpha-1,2-mannosyltransferase